MASVKMLALAGSAVILSLHAAGAADYALPPPPPPPPPAVEFSGWYLRGDVGMTNQRHDRIDNVLMRPPYSSRVEFLDKGGFDSGWLYGLGAGYQINPWFRVDVTGEYRGKTPFYALDRYDANGDGVWDGANNYSMRKSEWVFLANAYVDLGTWWCVTPFVGLGVGMARIDLDGFRDIGTAAVINIPDPGFTTQVENPNGVAYAAATSKWNFAWAAHAGLAYKVTPGFSVELAYRYLHLGDAQTGDLIAYGGANRVNNPTDVFGIYSHDVKLGVRWYLQPEPVLAPPPLVRKG